MLSRTAGASAARRGVSQSVAPGPTTAVSLRACQRGRFSGATLEPLPPNLHHAQPAAR